MSRLRAQRRVATWIAALAVLVAALAPAVSHALGGRLGASWVEVCTLQGAKWMQPGSDSTPASPASARLFDHCPFCSIHTPAIGVPPDALAAPALGEADFVPVAYLSAPHTPHVWAGAQPRAPPSLP